MAGADTLTIREESQELALECMRQKSLTDDAPEDVAREYRRIQQQIQAALETL